MNLYMDLPIITDSQSLEITERARLSGIEPNTCPTCYSIRNEDGERKSGKYFYQDEYHTCICERQIALRKHYLLANIPEQYMRLNLRADWIGDREQLDPVFNYIDHWMDFKIHGIGFELYSKRNGTGKTMTSTFIAKELIKRKAKVFFIPFAKLLNAFRYNEDTIIDRVYNSTVLILDEIIAPPHDQLQGIFAERFEDVIRNRTNGNGVNICTTNLEPSELHCVYPRTYSLLEAKQIRMELVGDDARLGFIADRNIKMALASEIQPIS